MENEIKRGDMQKIMEQFELLSEEIDQVLQAGPQALQTAWS
jgi:hypothetical protein